MSNAIIPKKEAVVGKELLSMSTETAVLGQNSKSTTENTGWENYRNKLDRERYALYLQGVEYLEP